MSKATWQKRPVKRDAGRFLLFFSQRSTLCPLWGTLSLGLFATVVFGLPTATCADTSTVVSGLFYGGGVSQLGTHTNLRSLVQVSLRRSCITPHWSIIFQNAGWYQALGSGVTVVATLGVSLVMMYALKYVGVLRVSKAGELEGLDLHEHGAVAYPDYALAD